MALDLLRIDLSGVMWVCAVTAALLLALRAVDMLARRLTRSRTRRAIERVLSEHGER